VKSVAGDLHLILPTDSVYNLRDKAAPRALRYPSTRERRMIALGQWMAQKGARYGQGYEQTGQKRQKTEERGGKTRRCNCAQQQKLCQSFGQQNAGIRVFA
jgi:hypothetical protein